MRPTYISTDNLSEISEAGTGRTGSTSERSAYSENREELLSALGLTEDDQVFQDKFRIDRRKLEEMILGDNETLDSTTDFFKGVMDDSGTHIAWPSRLKVGAKSKRDPHVRIAGRCPQDVQNAKEAIQTTLGIRNKQVTMKLSVSYTHHSHIIGEGGQTITKVRRETECHIHFPDSNRSASETKSNQVSITGTMDNVERARAQVRRLVPLVFTFELQVLGAVGGFQDSHYPYIQHVSEKYNVHVSCRTRSRLHATLVVVKGCEWEVERVKEATILLINYLCGSIANQVPVQMTMEISPHHHPIVLGPQSQYLKSIMDSTQTQIMFPDASDPNIPLLKKSNVTITGDIDNVYLARQQLMGSLPINLMFNLNQDSMAVSSDKINQICDGYDVGISTRQCPKQNTISVIIRGVERNIAGVYEARRVLLNVEDKVHAVIPETYLLSNPPKVFNRNELNGNTSPRPLSSLLTPEALCNLGGMGGMSPFSVQDHSPIMLTPSMYNQMWSPQVAPIMPPIQWGRLIMSPQQQQPQQARMRPSTVSRDSGYGSQISFSQFNSLSTSPVSETNPWLSSISSNTSSITTPGVSPRNMSPTVTGLEHQLSIDLANMMKNTPEWGDRLLSLDHSQGNLTPADYEQKKFMAMRALQNVPNSSEIRVPTSTWSGYGFSLTSPSALYTEQKPIHSGQSELDTDPWKGALELLSPTAGVPEHDPVNAYLRHSNTTETMPAGMLKRLQNCDSDLPTLLASLGLEKYIHLFKSQEIDLATFELFTEANLKEIGVHAYGARHKMLLAILDLKKKRSGFVSAAPGAERRSSRPHGWQMHTD